MFTKYDINEYLNDEDIDIDVSTDIEISVKIVDLTEDYLCFNFFLIYKENDIKHTIIRNNIPFKKENIKNAFLSCLGFLISIVEKQQRCEHKFEAVKDETGRRYPDGRAVCSLCSKKNPSFFPKDNNHQIANGTSIEYITEFNWQETFIQCGTSGIVINKKGGYKTAFFEAFPDIGKYPTFIRGEGKTVKDAEIECWNKYKKQKNCENHEFTRIVNGKEREDGYGVCIHCNLSSSKALEPLTRCCVCNKKTNDKNHNSKIYCYDDFFKIEVSHYTNQISNIINNFDKSDLVAFYHEFCIKKFIFNNYEYDFFIKNKDKLTHVYYHLLNFVLNKNFNIKPLSEISENYPEPDNPILLSCLDFFLKNIKEILSLNKYSEVIEYYSKKMR